MSENVKQKSGSFRKKNQQHWNCFLGHWLQVKVEMMHADQEQASTTDQPSEDDMAEGDLGDGTRSVAGIRKSRSRSKADFLDQMKWGSEGTGRSFSWTSCSAMYTAFRKELEAERISQWRIRDSGQSKSQPQP